MAKAALKAEANSRSAEVVSGVIRIGVGGWTYEPWRGTFYPAKHPHKRELEYASQHLISLEINGTFYGPQKPETFARWRDETPDGFVFSLKAPRFATHRRILAEAGASVERFVNGGLTELKDKLGVINWQFAPTKQFDPDDFAAFLKLLPKDAGGRALRHAVEVRHISFNTKEFVALLREYNVAVVIPGDSKHPLITDATASFVYARIMGTQASHPLGYPEAALDSWANRARIWSRGGAPDDMMPLMEADKGPPRDVFLYVIGGHKVFNPAAAMALIKRLS